MDEAGRAAVYREQVLALDRAGVYRMWQVVHAGDNLVGWPPGKALEYLILREFQLEGAEVTWPYEVRRNGLLLEQVDGAVYFDGLSCLVEAKDWRTPVDFSVVAKMKTQLLRRPAMTLGAVFLSGTFSDAATSLAQLLPPPNVQLWNGDDLAWAMERGALREGLKRKLRHAIEQGFGDLLLSGEGEEAP
ncbi:restriction endonuclease [Pyxidicoccus sp. 3LFB2]